MPRKLVTVRQISAISPITGADRIETATIDGWTCVVPVGDFKPGDRGLYFEIDSLLPGADPRWAFLAPKNGPTPPADIRVKTLRVRGVLSQGLLLPLLSFPEVTAVIDALSPAEIDVKLRDMSFEEVLRVRKYEKPVVPLPNGAPDVTPLPEFPYFVPKTEAERVQNLPDVFISHGDEVFQESTKMDGSSMTVFYLGADSPHHDILDADISSDGVYVCSRNRMLVENHPRSPPLFWSTARALNLPATLSSLGRNIAIQGELCGSSIQSNYEGFGRGEHNFFLFSVWDIDAQRYLPPREVHETWAPRLGVKHVPVHGYRPLKEIGGSVADLVARAEGKGVDGRKREGIVLKQEDGSLSFKAISNSYLLKHGE
ncbi:drb0094 family rna ligase [Fusarium albosuccineum]|uniref:Drb0094 family rna ligase n=1 Tax=Fusarium albosuccineum TaxID=1237068 RepID=A0A8H4LH54_9HYPO|nr:drb0094 family rna ligase [Fusarium albosuccineum]